MPDNTFCYITRPSSTGTSMTTMPKFRGTKSQAQIYAEVAAASGASEAVVAQVVKALGESIIDNTIACWKTDALGDGLIAFQCGCGGSSPIGEDPPSDFLGMGVNLNGHWGPAGRDRAQAAFAAQKVGEQSRITPVFVEVYDSASRTPNHYVAGGTITIVLNNRNLVFNPDETNNFVRYRKGDGTFVSAGGYPYHKGNTIVANVPAGLTGTLELRLQCKINNGLREGIYAFPLT